MWFLFFLCPFLLQWTGSANINWQRLLFCTKNITGVPVVDVNKHQRLSVRFDALVRTKRDSCLLRNASWHRWTLSLRLGAQILDACTLGEQSERLYEKFDLRENDARCLFYFDSSGRVQVCLSLGARTRVVQHLNRRFRPLSNRFSLILLARSMLDNRLDPLRLEL